MVEKVLRFRRPLAILMGGGLALAWVALSRGPIAGR